MTPRDERLSEAHEALGRMFMKCPIVFDQVQKRIVQEGPAFLDDLALRALDDKDHGRNPGDGWSNDLTAMAGVDASANLEQNAPVPFNSGASFSRLNSKADSRPSRHFLRPSCTIGTPSMSGLGVGGFRACRFLTAGLLTRTLCPAPSFSSDGPSLTLSKEATMPSIARALSRHHSPIIRTIGISATMAEAHIIARLHLARTGRAVRIQSAAVGFQIAEVR